MVIQLDNADLKTLQYGFKVTRIIEGQMVEIQLRKEVKDENSN